MKSGSFPKSIILVFVAIAAIYFGVFYGIEYLRNRKGPWEVEFNGNSGGEPTVVIRQPAVGLNSAKLIFHGESVTNGTGLVRFDRPLRSATFGTVIYEDLTFLPGVVTFDLFGHEIELLPRVLVVNKREIPWHANTVIDVWPTNKPAQRPHPPGKPVPAEPRP